MEQKEILKNDEENTLKQIEEFLEESIDVNTHISTLN